VTASGSRFRTHGLCSQAFRSVGSTVVYVALVESKVFVHTGFTLIPVDEFCLPPIFVVKWLVL
jgi:hypothetical protein